MTRHDQSVYRRRRRTAAAVLIALGLGVSIGLERALGEERLGPDPAEIERLYLRAVSDRALAGQALMVRMDGSASRELRRQARDGEIGGVIVFPPPGQPEDELEAEIRRLQSAAEAGGKPPLLVATDQEGGEVKRLPDGPPESAPPELGAAGEREARASGRDTGRYLAGLGINADLAPVLDVPASETSFIFSRTFGSDPGAVTDAGLAFAAGLERGGVLSAAKHFPGLGEAIANTDLESSTIDADERDLEDDLAPFRDAISRDVPMIMVGHAVYEALDPERPAALSPQIVDGLLRDDLGYEGVVISDDLGAGAVRAAVPEREAPVAAAAAGVDILLFAQTSDGRPALDALLEAVRGGELSRSELEDSFRRVLGLRESL